jgi:hypothetical protein
VNLTPEDLHEVRGVKRLQLLIRLREIDHSVELGCALARMPRQVQGIAVHIRETEARAKPDSIGAEVEISLSEAETLLRNGNTEAGWLVAAAGNRPELLRLEPLSSEPRIGLCRTPYWEQAEASAREALAAAVERPRAAGATLSDLALPPVSGFSRSLVVSRLAPSRAQADERHGSASRVAKMDVFDGAHGTLPHRAHELRQAALLRAEGRAAASDQAGRKVDER